MAKLLGQFIEMGLIHMPLQFGFVFLDWYRETPKINLIPSQLG